jgi:hypothetical protein
MNGEIMAEYDKLSKLKSLQRIIFQMHWPINPIKYMIDKAHAVGAAVLIDERRSPFKARHARIGL